MIDGVARVLKVKQLDDGRAAFYPAEWVPYDVFKLYKKTIWANKGKFSNDDMWFVVPAANIEKCRADLLKRGFDLVDAGPEETTNPTNKRREAASDEERTAIEQILTIDNVELWAWEDEVFGSSLARQFRRYTRLTDKQWAWVIKLAERYAQRLQDWQEFDAARERWWQWQQEEQQNAPLNGQPWWEVLGVDANATVDAIKKAFRRAAFEVHPDRNPDDASCLRKMQDLSAAYDEALKSVHA